MSAVAEVLTDLTGNAEADRVARWRFEMLLELGFSINQSRILIAVPTLDWHRAEYLVRVKGMPHELVVNELT